MPTLAATVDATLHDRGITKTEFCRSLGISRTTLARWETSFPSPDTLRSISTALDLPYMQLVTAALCSAGYLPTGDASPGLDVYLVVNTCEADDDDSYKEVGLAGSGPVAAYTNLAAAERYVASANRVAAFSPSFDTQILALDASPAPQIIDIFTTSWRTDGDIIHTSTSRSAHVPERFSRTRTTPVRARTNPDTGLVEGLEVASLDSDVGEHLLREYLGALDEHGLKHPASAGSPTHHRTCRLFPPFSAEAVTRRRRRRLHLRRPTLKRPSPGYAVNTSTAQCYWPTLLASWWSRYERRPMLLAHPE
ncbi:helix-turn-helix transcriptional regulator [Rhodococcus sp. BS-15]|uniref:helix-turn-helix domain-containing protein n=1 Tax=Rhodococcus sp. BS-15 TaxID=1304954 RepID=UPI000FFCA7EC